MKTALATTSSRSTVSPGDALGRVALDELDAAAASVQRATGGRHDAIHAARKSLRRLRAVLKLVPRPLRAGEGRVRGVARSLSAVRDAEVAWRSAQAIARDAAGHDREAWDVVARKLHAARDRCFDGALRADGGFARRLAALAAARAALDAASWHGVRFDELRKRLEASGARVEKARRRFERKPTAESRHRYRRRIRRLRMQLQCVRALSLRESNKECVRRARALLRRAVRAHGSIKTLSRASDALGAAQDRALLRRALRRLEPSDARRRALALLRADAAEPSIGSAA